MTEPAGDLGVSPVTLRRDIEAMAARGEIHRGARGDQPGGQAGTRHGGGRELPHGCGAGGRDGRADDRVLLRGRPAGRSGGGRGTGLIADPGADAVPAGRGPDAGGPAAVDRDRRITADPGLERRCAGPGGGRLDGGAAGAGGAGGAFGAARASGGGARRGGVGPCARRGPGGTASGGAGPPAHRPGRPGDADGGCGPGTRRPWPRSEWSRRRRGRRWAPRGAPPGKRGPWTPRRAPEPGRVPGRAGCRWRTGSHGPRTISPPR
ncbi:hypothetical protein [Streptomyces sp. AB3(2024)]|uniref:hypothetical protein n=1 Tax=Streptomyces sp. AB3(2024) TaxID=3317321 RepID=UPI0035A3D556